MRPIRLTIVVRHFLDRALAFDFLSPLFVGEYFIQYCADMCGRFTLHSRDRIKLKGLASLDLPFEPRYNIAPSQNVLTIADFGVGIEPRFLTWGLIPSWSSDGKSAPGVVSGTNSTCSINSAKLLALGGIDVAGAGRIDFPKDLWQSAFSQYGDRKANGVEMPNPNPMFPPIVTAVNGYTNDPKPGHDYGHDPRGQARVLDKRARNNVTMTFRGGRRIK
jgi:hypothetical protein